MVKLGFVNYFSHFLLKYAMIIHICLKREISYFTFIKDFGK